MKSKALLITLAILVFALAIRIVSLTLLPVFADEAIYTRWAQLIMDDPRQYLFFPLNDGKTPLFIWLLVPAQYLFADQLFAARMVSVLIGVLQVGLVGYILHLLSGRPKMVWLGMLFTAVLPFWYFHHRMALMDGLLTLWLSAMIIGLIKLCQHVAKTKQGLNRSTAIWTVVTAASFGLALWTKLPALLFAPTIIFFFFWPTKLKPHQRWALAVQLGAALIGGIVVFGTLKLSPAFGQLFSRGSDFLYPWQDVVLHGAWQQTIINIPTYVGYFMAYITTPILILVLAGLFLPPHRRINHVLFWSAMAFIGPIALLGRVVYPRYLLPAVIYLTIVAVLAFQDLAETWVLHQKNLTKKMMGSVLLGVFLANTFAVSGVFIFYSLYHPNQLPLVSADQTQYLTEWSSGHGITEAVALIEENSDVQTLAVATEGYFGTLPDGLLMYFHGKNVDNLYIEGIGQPVRDIPDDFRQRAITFDKTWLIVNSHRMALPLESEQLVAQFCRPQQAPCLQVWDITPLIQTPPTQN